MGGCFFSDGAIPESILLFWTVDISDIVLGLWGCGLAFGFRFRGCFGLRVTGDGEAGSFCRGLRLLGLGSGALVISDYK